MRWQDQDEHWYEWRRQCPLWRWRLQQTPPMRRNRLAQLLDVGCNTISYWERGLHRPREEPMEMITRVTGITVAQWERWLAQQPQPAQSPSP